MPGTAGRRSRRSWRCTASSRAGKEPGEGVAMSASVILQGFAYGECLDDLPQRSLGFRLLAPAEPEPWCPEVEALARLLQTAPYPDHWPPADLFCSVLLADGRRVVAVARYGLCDQ